MATRRLLQSTVLFSLLTFAAAVAPRLRVIEHALHGLHKPPPGMQHPEVPGRLEAAAAALRSATFSAQLDWASTSELDKTLQEAEAALGRVHSAEHLARIRATSARGGGGFDADTFCAPGSWRAVLDGTSAWLEAARLAAAGQGPALALARPPGHHATRDAPMGFCLVNFAAAAAADYLAANPNGRVAVLDWDVHHGNGVAAILASEPRARYCSTHEAGGFPRTGLDEKERGPCGNLLDLPLPPGSGGVTYLRRLKTEALPFLLGTGGGGGWKPDLLIICAGFDALDNDPLAGLTLHPNDFHASVEAIVQAGFPREKIALGLEGGYDLDLFAGMPGGLLRTCAALVAAP